MEFTVWSLSVLPLAVTGTLLVLLTVASIANRLLWDGF